MGRVHGHGRGPGRPWGREESGLRSFDPRRRRADGKNIVATLGQECRTSLAGGRKSGRLRAVRSLIVNRASLHRTAPEPTSAARSVPSVGGASVAGVRHSLCRSLRGLVSEAPWAPARGCRLHEAQAACAVPLKRLFRSEPRRRARSPSCPDRRQAVGIARTWTRDASSKGVHSHTPSGADDSPGQRTQERRQAGHCRERACGSPVLHPWLHCSPFRIISRRGKERHFCHSWTNRIGHVGSEYSVGSARHPAPTRPSAGEPSLAPRLQCHLGASIPERGRATRSGSCGPPGGCSHKTAHVAQG